MSESESAEESHNKTLNPYVILEYSLIIPRCFASELAPLYLAALAGREGNKSPEKYTAICPERLFEVLAPMM